MHEINWRGDVQFASHDYLTSSSSSNKLFYPMCIQRNIIMPFLYDIVVDNILLTAKQFVEYKANDR